MQVTGRGCSYRLSSAKAREEAKEKAVRVDDHELPKASFYVATSIPALLKRDIDGGACPQRTRMEMVDVRNLNLEVHPSPERVFQGSRAKPASMAVRLFEHQVDRSARQISEQLLGTFNTDTEAKNVYIEADRSGEIGDVKFGNDGRRSGHAAAYQESETPGRLEARVRGGETRQRGPVRIAPTLSHSGQKVIVNEARDRHGRRK